MGNLLLWSCYVSSKHMLHLDLQHAQLLEFFSFSST